MLIEFSNRTASLLKDHPQIAPLSWDGNKLDLASIKQLKGCRTELLQDCLRFIQKLDSLIENNFFKDDKEKNYADKTIQSLIAGLKKYSESCEYYPRIKDFLNIIPDNTSSMVGFTLVISALIAVSVFPPLAVIPLVILSWIMMDLFFNNREEASTFKDIVFTAKAELRTIEEATDILNKEYAIQTPSLPIQSMPSTSRDSSFYGAVNNSGETNSINSAASDSTPNLKR